MKKPFFRVIPRLDIKNGYLIKGINLEGLRVLGDPMNFSNLYYCQGADEICYIDNVATLYGTNNLSKFVTRTAKNIFIPLTVGGGIRSINDIEKMLNSGADKVSINSEAVKNKNFIYKSSRIFGSSTISVNLEYIKIKDKMYITTSSGRDIHDLNPVEWAKKVESLGAGEIILTSVDQDGTMEGYDLALIKIVTQAVQIPVVASGGAGCYQHMVEAVTQSGAAAVAAASMFHFTEQTPKESKLRLGAEGIPVRAMME